MKLSELKEFVEGLEREAKNMNLENPDVELVTYPWGAPNPYAGMVDVELGMTVYENGKFSIEIDKIYQANETE